MECRLVYVSSELEEMFTLREGTTTVGRDSSNDIQILKESISRHHARLSNLSSVCEVEDLNSANGTYVDGQRTAAMALKHGNEIRFGDEVFRFEEIGSIGSDDAQGTHRDYSDKAQRDTVKIKAYVPEVKQDKPAVSLPPLRPKVPKAP